MSSARTRERRENRRHPGQRARAAFGAVLNVATTLARRARIPGLKRRQDVGLRGALLDTPKDSEDAKESRDADARGVGDSTPAATAGDTTTTVEFVVGEQIVAPLPTVSLDGKKQPTAVSLSSLVSENCSAHDSSESSNESGDAQGSTCLEPNVVPGATIALTADKENASTKSTCHGLADVQRTDTRPIRTRYGSFRSKSTSENDSITSTSMHEGVLLNKTSAKGSTKGKSDTTIVAASTRIQRVPASASPRKDISTDTIVAASPTPEFAGTPECVVHLQSLVLPKSTVETYVLKFQPDEKAMERDVCLSCPDEPPKSDSTESCLGADHLVEAKSVFGTSPLQVNEGEFEANTIEQGVATPRTDSAASYVMVEAAVLPPSEKHPGLLCGDRPGGNSDNDEEAISFGERQSGSGATHSKGETHTPDDKSVFAEKKYGANVIDSSMFTRFDSPGIVAVGDSLSMRAISRTTDTASKSTPEFCKSSTMRISSPKSLGLADLLGNESSCHFARRKDAPSQQNC